MWRGRYASGNGPVARRRQASSASSGGMPTEARLEELIEAEPTILGEPLLIIGRQVATSFGKVIDLLAVDADGVLPARARAQEGQDPREVVAQVLDYGSWVRSVAHEDVLKLFADYGKGGAFEAAFQQRFDAPPPEELNTGHRPGRAGPCRRRGRSADLARAAWPMRAAGQ